MTNKELLPTTLEPTPEVVSDTCARLRQLATDKIDVLPDEIRTSVQSIMFSASRKGQPLDKETEVTGIMLSQVSGDWLLVELGITREPRYIRFALNEVGEICPMGNFNNHAGNPGAKLGYKFINGIGFYENLLQERETVTDITIRA
jgi:hypothetical protein